MIDKSFKVRCYQLPNNDIKGIEPGKDYKALPKKKGYHIYDFNKNHLGFIRTKGILDKFFKVL